ncbi:MAG: hypothetical protein GY940_17680 [bacterium]|nr:hypothetical protein [bacterium]
MNAIRNRNILVILLMVVAFFVVLYTLNLGYLGRVVFPLLKAVLLIVGIFIYGFLAMSLFKSNRESIEFASAFGVGLVVTTLFFFLAGFFKLIVPAVMFLFYFIPLPLLFVLLMKRKVLLKQTVGSFFDRSWLEYPVFFLPFIYASLPSSFYDTLVYHLGIPNLYLQQGGFIETPQFLFANTSIYYEVSLIPSVFAGDSVPRLFHFLIGVIFILAIADFAVEVFKIKKRAMFILLAMSMPMSVFLLSTVKNDLLGAFFVFLGIRYVLKRRYNLSALFWGFSIGIKYFNALPMVIFLAIFFLKEKQFPIKKLTLLGVVSAAVMAPLLIKNYIYAGNPVFPFLSDYFKSEYWDASRYALMKSDVGRMFYSLMDALKFPYTFSFQHSGFGGMVGAQFLIFMPFLLLVKGEVKKKWHFLLFACLTIYVGGNFTASVRFLFIALLFLTIYLAVIYESVTRRVVKVLFLFVIALNIIFSVGLQEFLYRSSELLSGAVNGETYKANIFPTYPGIAFVNRDAPGRVKPGSKAEALLVGEARNYYLKIPYRVASGIDYTILRKYLKGTTSAGEFTGNLRKDNIMYIILNMGEFNRLQNGYKRMNETELEQMGAYMGQLQSKIVFREGGNVVFYLGEKE